MTLARLIWTWDQWLTKPVSAINVSLLRIIYGFIFIVNAILLMPDRMMWFADGGPWSKAQAINDLGTDRIDLLKQFVATPLEVNLWFIALFVVGVMITLGIWTRVVLIIGWLMLVSMSHRVSVMIHSGDTLMRLIGFFLIFSPCHVMFSLDSLRAKKRNKKIKNVYQPTAQRILQLQLCLIYFVTSYWKLKGNQWHEGTAVGIVMNLTEFQRFPLPDFFRGLAMSKIMTGVAILVEMLFPILIWFKDTRMLALICGFMMHVGLEYSLNIQLFQPTILSLYILFLDPSMLERWASQRRSAV
jgi:hypothetical protein